MTFGLVPFLHRKAPRTAMYKRYINSIIIIIIIIIIIHASYSLPKWQAVKLTFFVP